MFLQGLSTLCPQLQYVHPDSNCLKATNLEQRCFITHLPYVNRYNGSEKLVSRHKLQENNILWRMMENVLYHLFFTGHNSFQTQQSDLKVIMDLEISSIISFVTDRATQQVVEWASTSHLYLLNPIRLASSIVGLWVALSKQFKVKCPASAFFCTLESFFQ